jgi:hypothetical protein
MDSSAVLVERGVIEALALPRLLVAALLDGAETMVVAALPQDDGAIVAGLPGGAYPAGVTDVLLAEAHADCRRALSSGNEAARRPLGAFSARGPSYKTLTWRGGALVPSLPAPLKLAKRSPLSEPAALRHVVTRLSLTLWVCDNGAAEPWDVPTAALDVARAALDGCVPGGEEGADVVTDDTQLSVALSRGAAMRWEHTTGSVDATAPSDSVFLPLVVPADAATLVVRRVPAAGEAALPPGWPAAPESISRRPMSVLCHALVPAAATLRSAIDLLAVSARRQAELVLPALLQSGAPPSSAAGGGSAVVIVAVRPSPSATGSGWFPLILPAGEGIGAAAARLAGACGPVCSVQPPEPLPEERGAGPDVEAAWVRAFSELRAIATAGRP